MNTKDTILLIEDDNTSLFALMAVLKAEIGAKLVIAKNGVQGLNILRQNDQIGIVLLDMMMPEMDGYEVLRTIRSSSNLQHLKVISITAQVKKGDREKCLDAGADDYCSKPIEIEELIDKIIAIQKLQTVVEG